MRRLWVLVALIGASVGCGSMPPPSACRTAGEACAVTSDCCTNLACFASTCRAGGGGGGGTGGGGGIGGGGGGGGGPTCASAGQFCTSGSACCANLSCLRYGDKCESGDIGDPCRNNGDCRSGLTCAGWCTKACSSNAQCTTTFDSPAGVNDCINGTVGGVTGFFCFPFCTTNAECTKFGPGLNCAPGTDPTGGSFTVCG